MRVHAREIVTKLLPYDVYITSTLPAPPRELGHFDMSETAWDKYNAKMRTDGVFCAPFNISGQPGMTLPLAMSKDNLPIGVQLVGRIGEERTLIALAAQLEQAMPWRDRKPPISV
jgi:amidase